MAKISTYPQIEELSNDDTVLVGRGDMLRRIPSNNLMQPVIKVQLDLQNYTEDGFMSKNLHSYTLEDIKAANTSGSWDGNTYTINGVKFVVNNDGTIDINGIPTSTTQLYFQRRANANLLPFDAGDYIINGANDTTNSSFSLGITETLNGSSHNVVRQNLTEKTFTYNSYNAPFGYYVEVYSGKQINTTIKPMIRKTKYIDSNFEPYVPSNRKIQDILNDIDVRLKALEGKGESEYENI